MSYIRFGEDGSDVYVYANTDGYLECCGCFRTLSAHRMIIHLENHLDNGECVPFYVIKEIKKDFRGND